MPWEEAAQAQPKSAPAQPAASAQPSPIQLPGVPGINRNLPQSPAEAAVSKEQVKPWEESGLSSFAHGFGLPTTTAEQDRAQLESHPIQAAVDAIGGPAYGLLKGASQGAVRSIGELTQAGEGIEENNPAKAAVHVIQAVPFIGAGIQRGVQQLGPDGQVNPAVAGTVAATTLQTAPIVAGGWEGFRDAKAAEMRGQPPPPPGGGIPQTPTLDNLAATDQMVRAGKGINANQPPAPAVPEQTAPTPAPQQAAPAVRPPTPTAADIFDTLKGPEPEEGQTIHAGPKPVSEAPPPAPEAQAAHAEPSLLDQIVANWGKTSQTEGSGSLLDQIVARGRFYNDTAQPFLDELDRQGGEAHAAGDMETAERAAQAHTAASSVLDEIAQNKSQGGRPTNPNLAAAQDALSGRALNSPEQTSPAPSSAPKMSVKDLASLAIASMPQRPVPPKDAPKPLQPATAQATNQPQPIGKHEPDTGRQILQSTDNPATLQKAAQAQAPWLEKQASATVAGIPGAKVEGIREKKAPADLAEKLDQEKQPAETIPDYLGGRIVVDSPAARDQVAQKIRANMQVIRETDNFEKGSDPYGFRSHTFQVKTPDGNSAEMQVVPKEQAEVNDQTHPQYEQGEKARIAGNKEQHQQIAGQVRAKHDAAMERFNQRNASNQGAKQEATPQSTGVAAPFTPKKGDRVLMDGKKPGTVTYADPKRKVAGVKTDDGRAWPAAPFERLKPEEKKAAERETTPEEYRKIKSDLLRRGLNPDDTEAWGTAVAEEERKLFQEPSQSPAAQNQPVAGKVEEGGSKPSESAQPEAKGDKWIGVDLDGTLAHYDGFKGPTVIGEPIQPMVDRIKKWLAEGNNVKILTARVADDKDGKVKKAIQDWTEKHVGKRLDVTDVKDPHMVSLYDDRAVPVERNTGKLLAEPQPEGNNNNAKQSGISGESNAAPKAEGGGNVPSQESQPAASNAGAKPAAADEPAAPAGKQEKPLEQSGDGEKEVKTTKYKYGNTQADIPADSEAGKALAAARAKIDPDDLMPSTNTTDGSGLEEDSHITIRYGIEGDDTSEIRAFLEKQAPFEATLGKVTSFPPSEHSDGAAPIVVAIESPDLRRLEKELDQHGKFIDRTFPDYKPHATLGYVKPDAAKKYVGMGGMEGKKFTVSSVSISKKDGSKEEVQLKGKKTPSFYKPTPQVAPMAGTSPLGVKPKSSAEAIANAEKVKPLPTYTLKPSQAVDKNRLFTFDNGPTWYSDGYIAFDTAAMDPAARRKVEKILPTPDAKKFGPAAFGILKDTTAKASEHADLLGWANISLGKGKNGKEFPAIDMAVFDAGKFGAQPVNPSKVKYLIDLLKPDEIKYGELGSVHAVSLFKGGKAVGLVMGLYSKGFQFDIETGRKVAGLGERAPETAAPETESEPVAETPKPTKAAIIPTRDGVKAVPIQEPVEKSVEKEETKPSEAPHEPTSRSEAGGGRPAADTGSRDREGVAKPPAGLREESPEGKPAETPDTRDGAGLHPSGKPVRGVRPESGPGEGSAASLDSSPAQPVVEDANKQQRRRTKLNQDWFQHPDDWQVPGGAMTRLDGNIAALEILRDVQKNPRKVTDDEKAKLANYIGWGSLSKVFDENYLRASPWERNTETVEKRRWREAHLKLKELLTPEEYDAARRSTQNAHYTSPDVVRFMWDAVKRMGFKSGNVLEPSIGVGNFFGMMPPEIRAQINGVADELDPITHGIAQLLYPGATVFNKDFVELIMPDNEIDLAIGNVPFGEAVYDPKYPKMKARIHDYFFVKSMDKVKPGGMVAFITSTGTMDKANPAIRHMLASQADLVTAFRLPSSAFKANAGTDVTTDVIFLRKRLPGEKPAGEAWTKSPEMEVPVEDEDRMHKLNVNEFYQSHPENMLGNAVASGRMYGGLNFMLNPSDTPIEELLSKALASVPKSVLGAASVSKPSGLDMASTASSYASDDLKEYQYTVEKGQLKQRVQGKLVRPSAVVDKSGVVNAAKVDRIKAMVGLREKLNALMAAMATMPDEDVANDLIAIQRKDLLKSYDSFVKQYGYLNSAYNGLFREDPHYPRLLALENYDKAKKKGEPADIFKKRTIFPRQPLRVVSDDPREALQQVMGERGYPDVNLLAQLQGKEPKEVAETLVKKGLVFRNPTGGDYETREKYLSGYVRDKLDDARKAVAQGLDEYKPNVAALEKVQPTDLEIGDDPETSISVRLGGTWIPIPALENFFEQTFRSSADIGYAGGTWSVNARSQYTPEIVTEWAGGGVKADELFTLALNQKQPTVYLPKNSDGTGGGIDAERTTAARAMQERIRVEFQKWAGQSKKWKAPLEKAYNYAFNNLVTTEYDGSHLTFPGMNPDIKLKSHQVNAVWRMLQDGQALLAHEVGAGKTFEMVAAVMEGKRTGLFKKPMIAVPNHIVDQFRKEFLLLYPGANLLVPTEKDFDSKNRQRIMSQIATGDYDAIILPHSQFNLMDISPERQLMTIEKQMDELEETLAAMKKAAGKRDRSVKELEKAKEKLRTRIAELRNLKADKAINFDDTGVDALFIDEAHEYKNLTFYTKMTRIAGIQQGNAKRALRLKMKTEYLQDKNKGRGVFFATGTPVQNTMAELYTMIKYVAPEVLEKAGIRFFDDWAANFGSTITAMELSADGRSFKARTKFARFQNVPELMQMFRSFADVKTAADLNLPRPELDGGKPIVVSVPGSELLDAYVKDLMDRAAHLPKDPKEDNMLKIVSEGRKAATDMRLLDQEIADERDSKINVAVRQVFREWEEGKPDSTTQMVFLDMYRATSEDDKELINLYDDMRKKLIASGVPAHEIAVIGEHNTRLKRQALFDKMNDGEVRILLGSTQKMGAGTNAQRKLKALHHIDLTWRPGDLTQREGRILRQGNTNKSVRIYNYLTERSFDAYMAQTLQSKAEFLSQILSGRAKGRTALDAAADMVLSLEEMKVAASGNPDIKKKYDLEMRRSQLYSLEREFDAKRRDVKWRAESAELYATNARARAAALEKTMAKIDAVRGPEGEGFEMEVDGHKFTDSKAATDFLEAMELPEGTFWLKLNGVTVVVKPRVENRLGGKGEDGKTTHVEYALDYENQDHTIPEQTMASLARSINARLREVPSDIRRSKEQAERQDEEARRFRAQLEKKDFPEKDELDKVEKDLREVEKRLGLGNINSGSQAAAEETQADVDAETPDVEVPEKDEEEEDAEDGEEAASPADTAKKFLQGGRSAKLPDQPKTDPGSTLSAFGFLNPAMATRLFPGMSGGIYQWAGNAPTPGKTQQAIMREERGEMDRRMARAMAALEKESNAWDKRPRADFLAFADAVEHVGGNTVANLSPKDQALARVLETAYQERKDYIDSLGTGVQKDWIENYFAHWWEHPSQARKTIMKFMGIGKRPLEGKASFRKKRSIPTTSDGIAMGLTPSTWNPVRGALMKIYEMDQFIMAHQVLKVMKDSGTAKFVRAGKDAPEGWTKLDDKIGTVWRRATTIDDQKVEDATYDKTYMGGKRPIPSIAIEDLDEASGQALVITGHYWAPKDAAKVFNNFVSKGLSGRVALFDALRWANNNLNALQLGISAFHATVTTVNAAASDVALGIEQLSQGKPVKAAGNVLAGLALPVSLIRTMVNGIKATREYMKPGTYPEMEKEADWIARSGGRTAPSTLELSPIRKAINAFASGTNWEKTKALPGALLQTAIWPVLGFYVPKMKIGAFYMMAHNILEEGQKKNWTPELLRDRMQEAWDSVDNRFGQIVYENRFWPRALKDTLQLTMRSVGYTWGDVHEYGGAIVDAAKIAGNVATGHHKDARITPKIAFALSSFLCTAMLGAAGTFFCTGHLPKDPLHYLYIEDSHGVQHSIAGYPDQIVSFAHDPKQTALNKVAPIWSAIGQAINNQDFYHTEIRHPDDKIPAQAAEFAEWTAKQELPFSATGAAHLLEERGAQDSMASMIQTAIHNPGPVAESFFGFNQAPAFIQNSEALNKARDYARTNAPPGTKTKEQYERTEAMHVIEDMYRSGKPDKQAIQAFKDNHVLSADDVLRAKLYSHSDPLVRAVRPLSIEQALNVYLAATDAEKKTLRLLLEGKSREIPEKINDPQHRAEMKKAYHDALNPKPKFNGKPTA
jgi:N12 class adenine-specific DNA methylase/2'-5' RNA ligase